MTGVKRKEILNVGEKQCDVFIGSLPVDVFILHGYRSKVEHSRKVARRLNDAGYNVYCCEYIGHGRRKREGSNKMLFTSMTEIESVIKSRKNAVVLIGHSIGGGVAITIGSRLSKVKQVFAISAPYGDLVQDKKQLSKISVMFMEKYSTSDKRQLMRVMPMIHGECKIDNESKFFLVHCKNDGIVPFSEFLKNKEMLCLPDGNTLVFDKISGVGPADHILAQYNDETMRFIESHIAKR